MKFVLPLILLGLSLNSYAASPCSSQVVTWPQDVLNNCGDQIWDNGQITIGQTFEAVDPVNSGSDASFECTAKGWQFVTGQCNAFHNYDCIAKRLEYVNHDNFGGITSQNIVKILNSAPSLERSVVVKVTNACDQISIK